MSGSGLIPLLVLAGAWGAAQFLQATHRKREWARLDRTLLEHLPYYAALPAEGRRRFQHRVAAILREKEFIGRSLEVTPLMRTLISGCIAQLTFGLPTISLAHFTRILVYPDRYRSRIGRSDHVGEVNIGFKTIVLSWKRFREDYRIGDDARNLGLHEMAHALWFENGIDNEEYDFLDRHALKAWREAARVEAGRIHAGRGGLFRAYAGTNQEEFFAVAVEYFFERPVDFRRELPERYGLMRDLLKQDPAASIPAVYPAP